MPFALHTTYRKPKKGTGTSLASALLDRELDIIEMASKDIFDNIISVDYYDKQIERIAKAIDNPVISQNKRLDLLTQRDKLIKEKEKWQLINSQNYSKEIKDIKGEFDDYWKLIWQDKELLQTGNIAAMAFGMLEGITEKGDSPFSALGELKEIQSELEEYTADHKILQPIEEKIRYLEEGENFWRGVMSYPDNYAIALDPFIIKTEAGDQRTAIKNLMVVDRGKIPAGFADSGVMLADTIPLYSKSVDTDEDGNDIMMIGNNTLKGSIKDKVPFELQDKEEFDFSSLTPVPFGNYPLGTILKTADERYKVMQPNGGFVEYAGDDNLAEAGFDKEQAVGITNDDDAKINMMFGVQGAERIEKEKKINEQMEAIIGQYQDQTSPWYQYKNRSAEDVAREHGEAVRQIFAGVPEAGKGVVEAIEAGRQVLGAVPKVIAGGYRKGYERTKATIQKAPRMVDTARKIFKGFFTGIKK